MKYQHDGAACPAVLEPSGGTDQGALVSDSLSPLQTGLLQVHPAKGGCLGPACQSQRSAEEAPEPEGCSVRVWASLMTQTGNEEGRFVCSTH